MRDIAGGPIVRKHLHEHRRLFQLPGYRLVDDRCERGVGRRIEQACELARTLAISLVEWPIKTCLYD